MKKLFKIFVFYFSIILFLLSCGLTPKRTSSIGPVIRDVPMQARGGLEEPRKRIMVLPFLDEKQDRSVRVSEISRNAIVQELMRTGRFVIIRNSDFPTSLEQFKTKEGDYDLEKISQKSAGMGVAAVLEGKIMEIKAKKMGDKVGLFRKMRARVDTVVRIRMFSSKNGKEILNEMRESVAEAETTHMGTRNDSDSILDSDPALVHEGVTRAFWGTLEPIIRSVEKLSWEGRVALVSGEKIYLNAGRLSGIQIGDILKVTEESEEIFDPETGKFIGAAPGRMKGTIEVTSYFGKDGSIAVVHSGSGFQENDRVELY